MKRYFLTYEEASTESLRLGTLIREKNQAYLDKLGKGQKDNTLKWDEPKEEYNGWSLQDHPDMQGYVEIPEEPPLAKAARGAQVIIETTMKAMEDAAMIEGDDEGQLKIVNETKAKLESAIQTFAP
jgi:hypothetical protein